MAFHPFRHFRKHQKVYLAIVTILTMFIFIFTGFASRGADPVTRLLLWIGGGRHGDKVITLYGKSIHEEELGKIRWQRQLASEFMLFDISSMSANMDIPLQQSLMEYQRKFSRKEGSKELITPIENAFNQMMSAIRFTSEIAAGNVPLEQRLQPLRNALSSIQRQLEKTDPSNEQYSALDAIATNLALQSWFVERGAQLNDSYFGGSLRAEDLLDFLIWKRQADQLGIVLTPADVCREVNRAWGNGKNFLPPDGKFDQNEWVNAFFHNNSKVHKNLMPRDLLSALTDEFRVQMAKEALLGRASGVRGYRAEVDGVHVSPSAATPDEFYNYFARQRTALSVSLLPIAVEHFVPEAKRMEQPTDTDLRNLYERYKNDEPAPAKRQPGFKEPRRIKVESIHCRLESAFARKLAAKSLELLPVFRVTQPAVPFAAGGGPAWAASMAGIAGYADLDSALRSLHEKYLEEAKQFGWTYDLPDSRTVELRASAATVGKLLGSMGSGGTPLAGPTSWLATNALYQRNTIAAYASTMLADASSTPLPALTLPLSLYHPQPLEMVRNQLIERFELTWAKRIMTENILEFRKELDKVLASRSEPKRAELLKKAVAEYGSENVHTMKETRTRQEILDGPDPALKELHQAYDSSQDNPFETFSFGPREPRPDFVSALFHSAELSPMERRLAAQGVKFDRPLRSWQFNSPFDNAMWVFWRAEDKPAHVRPFEGIHQEVEDAWYTEQARRIARKKAQQINEELERKKQSQAPEDAVRLLVEQNLGSVFTLSKVSHLTTPEFSLPGTKNFTGDYRAYVPPRELLPYPPADFVDQLLKLKKRGDSLVLTDQPVKHFYIIVLMEDPQPPPRQEFYDVYGQPTPLDNFGLFSNRDEQLWHKMMRDRQRKFAQQLLEQLRAEATPDLQDGAYVLPEAVRNRGDSTRDSDG